MPQNRILNVFLRELKFFYCKYLLSVVYNLQKPVTKDIYTLSAAPDHIGGAPFDDYTVQDHKLDLFGDLNWKKDYKTDYIYPDLRFGKFITTSFSNKGSDVKFPWDLSRFSFVPPIVSDLCTAGKQAEAYAFYKGKIESFVDSNKFLYGVNWICTMEVSIRVANWLFALPYLENELKADKAFRKKLDFALFRHGAYIDSFTEHKDNNHDISNYAGLFLVGIYFNNKKWIKKAQEGLEYEIRKQILPDGSCYELSTYYHRLDLEFFATSLYIGRCNGFDFSEEYIAKVNKMFFFAFDLMASDGFMPIVNDNDGGRFVIFNNGNENDFSYLKNFHNKLFTSKIAGGTGKVNNLFVQMPQIEPFKGLEWNNKPAIVYPDSQFYKVKNSHFEILLSGAGLQNMHKQGHKHMDAGAVVINLQNEPIIVDLGTTSYTRSIIQRNIDRSISAHNTVVPTSLIDKYTCKGRSWGKLPGYPDVEVTTFTNQAIACTLKYGDTIVTRNIFISESEIEITDECPGEDISVFYHTDKPFEIQGNVLQFSNFKMTIEASAISKELCIYASNYGIIQSNANKIKLQGISKIKTLIQKL